jgi:hypothetical protein
MSFFPPWNWKVRVLCVFELYLNVRIFSGDKGAANLKWCSGECERFLKIGEKLNRILSIRTNFRTKT